MSKNIYYYLGFAVGFALAIIILSIIFTFRKRKGLCKYDERQELARTKACKYGLIVLVAYLIIFGLLNDMDILSFGSYMTSNLIGICLSVGVFAVNSIWNDAYFAIKEKPKRFYILFTAALVLNIIVAIRSYTDDFSSEILSWNLIVAIMLAVILIVMVIKGLRHNRLKEEE